MLSEINSLTLDVILDLRYATNNNFTNKQIYKQYKCLVHIDLLNILIKAIDIADSKGYTIKIFDGFRPPLAQELLWSIFPDERYVSPPSRGSIHTRGVAVDLTLVDKSTGLEVDMGTPFDDFTQLSNHLSTDISIDAQNNRKILLDIMNQAGLDSYVEEWWHYQIPNALNYPMLNENYDVM